MEHAYELIARYAEVNDMSIQEAAEQYVHGHITNNDLWEAWLEYEGIIGYASTIKQIALELFAPEKLQ